MPACATTQRTCTGASTRSRSPTRWARRRTPFVRAPRRGGAGRALPGRIRGWRGAHDAHALALFEAEGTALEALCRVADDLRREAVGDEVTYVVNRNINFTNVCYTGCRFCAFAQREVDAESYTLSLDEVAERAQEAWEYGATEVCIQGGLHPGLPGDFYFRILDAIKARVPDIHIHAFSPMEMLNGATRLGISFREFLTECRAGGSARSPGTAAEILDDEVRWVLTKGKLPADTWEEIVRDRPRARDPDLSTIMYGHVDAPAHWVAHIRRLGRIQRGAGRVHRSSSRCPSSTRTRRSTSPARRVPGPSAAGQPPDARGRADPAGRPDPQRPGLVGEDGDALLRGDPPGGCERLRRHADGGDDLADGRGGYGIRKEPAEFVDAILRSVASPPSARPPYGRVHRADARRVSGPAAQPSGTVTSRPGCVRARGLRQQGCSMRDRGSGSALGLAIGRVGASESHECNSGGGRCITTSRGRSAHDAGITTRRSSSPRRAVRPREAKRICADCPVRIECLNYALRRDERYGVWGGMSERERRRLKRMAS